MATITAVGIKNLRSLKSIEPSVRLAPITVLLGKNSVGKSTFARLFPLLRQSSERRKRSPVLWFGDLVDFGSLGKAVTVGESTIRLKFEVELEDSERQHKRVFATDPDRYWHAGGRSANIRKAIVSITLAEDEATRSSYAKNLTIEALGGEIQLNFLADGGRVSISINGREQAIPSSDHSIIRFQGDLLPTVLFLKRQNTESGQPTWIQSRNPWQDSAAQLIKHTVHGNTGTATARRIAAQLPLGTISEIDAAIPNITGPHSWKTFANDAAWRSSVTPEIHTALLAGNFTEIIDHLDTALSKYFLGVRYIKPLRATAQRYYRRLDVSVSEIDPEGSNLPMFLDTLRPYELNSFQKWLRQYLDIEVHAANEGEQLMVMAKGPNDSAPFNIADMGFGISQVLPIAAQLWATRRSIGNVPVASVVVLEQPELHLHPEYQSRLADVFAGTVKDQFSSFQSRPLTLVVETHSQHLVNRLGQLVEAGKLAPEDVRILLFEPNEDSKGCTAVRTSEFNKAGVLQNWPFGFFEPGNF